MDPLAVPVRVTIGVAGSGDPAPVLGRLDGILAHTPHTFQALSAGAAPAGFSEWRGVSSPRALVEGCDLLIAFSDGDPAVLAAARAAGRTIYLVAADGGVAAEPRADRLLDSLRALDAYNAEWVDAGRIARGTAARVDFFRTHLRAAGLDPALLDPVAGSLLPYYVRTRLLADRYGLLHLGAGTAVYALSAAAIAVVTVQALLLPDLLSLVWIEVGAIAAVLLLLIAARTLDWHRKWLDYRFLAERVRSAIFLCFVCIRCEIPGARQGVAPSHHYDDWMSRTFEGLLGVRPIEYCSLAMPMEPIKHFLIEAWISRQIDWYAETARKNRRRYEGLLHAGEFFFIATLIAAAAHVTGVFHGGGALLAAATIVLPAVAATLSAIRIQREYRHNAERAAAMLRHLSSISLRIREAGTMDDLCDLLEEANEVMLREQQEWRVVFRFRELEGV